MTNIILFNKDNLFTGQFSEHKTDDLAQFLVDRYKDSQIPFSVFNGIPSVETDITRNVDILCSNPENVTIMEMAAGGLDAAAWVYIISAVISVGSMIYMYTHQPKIPNNIKRDQQSPNNLLGNRTNTARPLERIPDIKGTVRAVPDIIMPSWSYYKDDDKFSKWELGYYCVGRKQIELSSIRESETPIDLIVDSNVEVYYPSKNPKLGSTPDLQIGADIEEALVIPYRNTEVDKLDLSYGIRWTVDSLIEETGKVTAYLYYDTVSTSTLRLVLSGGGEWLPSEWDAGNKVYINFTAGWIPSTMPVPETTHEGYYIVQSNTYIGASTYDVVLNMPITVPPGTSQGVVYLGGYGSAREDRWFYMTTTEFDRAIINVEALNGLGRDTGLAAYKEVSVDYTIELELLDSNNDPTGLVYSYDQTISGSVTQIIGKTTTIDLPYPSKFRVDVQRTTNKIVGSGSYIQDIVLSDIYGMVNLENDIDFGNVTTIYTRTNLSPRANTPTVNRQLNCLATEMVYVHDGVSFAGSLTTNASAIQSYITDFVDPAIGGRTISELDVTGLLDVEQEILTYFNDTNMIRFDWSFDSTDITFQEETSMIFNAINCVAYRDGSLVKAFFEQPVVVPVQIFTHRSKIPNTETYTRHSNFFAENDGIEYVYTDPDTNIKETLTFPVDELNIYSPKRIEQAGIRNYNQALKNGYRQWNRLQNEKEFMELSVTPEGRFLRPGDVISVTKGTRSKVMDGEVLDVDNTGYILTLSQDVTFYVGMDHSVILKYNDGTIEGIGCSPAYPTSPQLPTNEIMLDSLPSKTILTSTTYGRRTEFVFGADDIEKKMWWIVREINASDKYSINLKCTKYKDELYADDGIELFAFSDGFSNGFS